MVRFVADSGVTINGSGSSVVESKKVVVKNGPVSKSVPPSPMIPSLQRSIMDVNQLASHGSDSQPG